MSARKSSLTIDAAPLDAGDIVWVDLRPVLGREQGGVRPAIVLSTQDFHRLDQPAIVCPVTSNAKP